jgi:hypothetical protein
MKTKLRVKRSAEILEALMREFGAGTLKAFEADRPLELACTKGACRAVPLEVVSVSS